MMTRVNYQKRRMAKSCKKPMTYYERLLRLAEKSVDKHPNSTTVIDARTLAVVTVSKSDDKIRNTMKAAKQGAILGVFEKPKVNQLLMLGFRPRRSRR